jgi:hypothetical protein
MARMEKVRVLFTQGEDIGYSSATSVPFGPKFHAWVDSTFQLHMNQMREILVDRRDAFLTFWGVRENLLRQRRQTLLRGGHVVLGIHLPVPERDCIEFGMASIELAQEPSEAAPKRRRLGDMPSNGPLGFVCGATYWLVRWTNGETLGIDTEESKNWESVLHRPAHSPSKNAPLGWKLDFTFPPLTPAQIAGVVEPVAEIKQQQQQQEPDELATLVKTLASRIDDFETADDAAGALKESKADLVSCGKLFDVFVKLSTAGVVTAKESKVINTLLDKIGVDTQVKSVTDLPAAKAKVEEHRDISTANIKSLERVIQLAAAKQA